MITPERFTLSLIIPAYNEEENIEEVVKKVFLFLPEISYSFEVIVVNDGSSDRTGEILARLEKKFKKLRVITHASNYGYGAALLSGFAAASQEWIFFMDGDGQFDIRDLILFLPYIGKYQVIAGYRKKRMDKWYRIVYARIFFLFCYLLFGIQIKDINCAFKLIRGELLKQLKLESKGATINAEMLAKMKIMGVTIKEVGVEHFPRKRGRETGGNLAVVVKALLSLAILSWKIRDFQAENKYREKQ
ncbi:MAG: glycosyltransferase family 2 protein [Caldiserica bacterium]|nr:glycosyltransferase family 2 protein [Caldisericota bacterium]